MGIVIGQWNVISLVNNFACYARKAHLNNFANHHQNNNYGCISDVLHIRLSSCYHHQHLRFVLLFHSCLESMYTMSCLFTKC